MLTTLLTSVMPDGFNVKALRAFRVLRPLRLVSGVPSKIFDLVYDYKVLTLFTIYLNNVCSQI